MLGTPALHAAIAARVAAFWQHEGSAHGHRVLPDGCMDFLFDLETGEARLIGAMTSAEVVQIPSRTRLFGVRFHPGAAAPFLSDPASAFLDQDAPLSAVTAPASRALAERIANARSRAERETLVAEHLLDPRSRLRAPDRRVLRAAAIIAERNGAVPLARVAAAVALSERQLERLFRAHVGIAPKHYARIARLEHTSRLLDRARHRQADLAVLAGYADESHLLRDFRALAGATPNELRAERRHEHPAEFEPTARASA